MNNNDWQVKIIELSELTNYLTNQLKIAQLEAEAHKLDAAAYKLLATEMLEAILALAPEAFQPKLEDWKEVLHSDVGKE
jgi:hypothetical protein